MIAAWSRRFSTNVGFQAQFRSSLADAQAFAHLLPERDGQSPTSARREQVEELTRLRKRHYYLALRDAAFRARVVHTMPLDFDELSRRAESLPAHVRERIKRAGQFPETETAAAPAEAAVDEPDAAPTRPRSTTPPDPGSFPTLG